MNDHTRIDSAWYILYKKFSAWITEAGAPIGFFREIWESRQREASQTTRVYFRLPRPAGNALGGLQIKNGMEISVFFPKQVSQTPSTPQGGVSPASIRCRQTPGSE